MPNSSSPKSNPPTKGRKSPPPPPPSFGAHTSSTFSKTGWQSGASGHGARPRKYFFNNALNDALNSIEAVDFSPDTWLSLLGLLRPIEFFFTLDHFPIWRRHMAWSKSKGDALRNHTIQRFSSSMVFLSLLLGINISLLFNSARTCEEMRVMLQTNQLGDIKYWIGVCIILCIITTLSALVATFTAWGMVSAIADSNVHCVLRSSIGQYVTQLPARLLVSSLYFFLLSITFWIPHMLGTGWVRYIVILFCIVSFFQVIIAYSCFGRLLIHTGALGEERVFDDEFEKALLPSGLHASLLIKATDQVLKRTSIITQYHPNRAKASPRHPRKQPPKASPTSGNHGKVPTPPPPPPMEGTKKQENRSSATPVIRNRREVKDTKYSSPPRPPRHEGQYTMPLAGGTTEEAMPLLMSPAFGRRTRYDATSLSPTTPNRSRSLRAAAAVLEVAQQQQQLLQGSSHRKNSIDSMDSTFQASKKPPFHVRTESIDLEDLYLIHETARSLGTLGPIASVDRFGGGGEQQVQPPPFPSLQQQQQEEQQRAFQELLEREHRKSVRKQAEIGYRQSIILGKRVRTNRILKEWDDENDVRETYNLPPPVDLMETENEEDYDDEEEMAYEDGNEPRRKSRKSSLFERMPRPSILNSVSRLPSLRLLTKVRSFGERSRNSQGSESDSQRTSSRFSNIFGNANGDTGEASEVFQPSLMDKLIENFWGGESTTTTSSEILGHPAPYQTQSSSASDRATKEGEGERELPTQQSPPATTASSNSLTNSPPVPLARHEFAALSRVSFSGSVVSSETPHQYLSPFDEEEGRSEDDIDADGQNKDDPDFYNYMLTTARTQSTETSETPGSPLEGLPVIHSSEDMFLLEQSSKDRAATFASQQSDRPPFYGSTSAD